MFYYARSDTHYLLYIYDMLRNELAGFTSETYPDEKPIDRVIRKSKEVSLQRYEHPFCDAETGAGNRGWYNTLIKSPTLYNGEQFAVYKAVHKWRDDVARREDESPPFIMTQQVLSDIARIMPTDLKALWSLLESNARGLKSRLNELFGVIQEARAKGAKGPTMLEFFRQSSAGTQQTSLGGSQATVTPEAPAEPRSIGELKSSRSQLWGSVPLNSARDGSVRPIDNQEMVPLYTFDFDAVKEELPSVTAPPPKPGREEPAKPAAAPADEGFTLKAGRKRKSPSDDAEAEEEPETWSVPETDSDVEMNQQSPSTAATPDDAPPPIDDDLDAPKRAQRQAKRDAKREFKRVQREAKDLLKQGDADAAQRMLDEAKRAHKTAKQAHKRERLLQQQQQQETPSAGASEGEEEEDGEQEEEEEEEQPFDYANASSVLHANDGNNNNSSKGGRRGGKPVFDPYAHKAGNAPQGARKMNYEKKGRTATFRK